MQWTGGPQAGFSTADRLYLPVIDTGAMSYHQVNVQAEQADPSSLLSIVKHMIGTRRGLCLGRGSFDLLAPDNLAILAYLRQYGEQKILIVNNLSPDQQTIALDTHQWAGSQPVDLLSGRRYSAVGDQPWQLRLAPYQYLWLQLQR